MRTCTFLHILESSVRPRQAVRIVSPLYLIHLAQTIGFDSGSDVSAAVARCILQDKGIVVPLWGRISTEVSRDSLSPQKMHTPTFRFKLTMLMESRENSEIRVVPRAGVEPARPCGQRILSPFTAM
jgi:hypothetical protein